MINIRKDHVPTASKKRTGIAMKPLYITVHSTGNQHSTAKNERAWLNNPSNTSVIGYHYVVDDTEAIEVIPPNEVAWHAGDGRGQGNMTSIGIEICESGNRQKTLDNAVKLVQYLMKEHNIAKVVRHYDWSKKNCPRILNSDGKWTKWNEFYDRIMKSDEFVVTKTKIDLNGEIKEVDAINVDGSNYIKLRDLADSKIVVDYDAQKKIPIITTRVQA